MAAMVAFIVKQPAKCVPPHMDDMRMTAKETLTAAAVIKLVWMSNIKL